MKTAIIYASMHQGNTKKIVESIALKYQVDLIDILKNRNADLSEYDCIGIASGIAFGKYYPQILEYLNEKMPEEKNVFFIHTAGDPREKHNVVAKEITDERRFSTFSAVVFNMILGIYLFSGKFKEYGNSK